MKRHRGILSKSISASTMQDMSVKPTKTRGIPILLVACPDCGAAVGQKCLGVKYRHPSRHRIAARHYLDATPEEREAMWHTYAVGFTARGRTKVAARKQPQL